MPNVNRLSCRPPAETGFQPTTTFYSRASPVNRNRWLGRFEVHQVDAGLGAILDERWDTCAGLIGQDGEASGQPFEGTQEKETFEASRDAEEVPEGDASEAVSAANLVRMPPSRTRLIP